MVKDDLVNNYLKFFSNNNYNYNYSEDYNFDNINNYNNYDNHTSSNNKSVFGFINCLYFLQLLSED